LIDEEKNMDNVQAPKIESSNIRECRRIKILTMQSVI